MLLVIADINASAHSAWVWRMVVTLSYRQWWQIGALIDYLSAVTFLTVLLLVF